MPYDYSAFSDASVTTEVKMYESESYSEPQNQSNSDGTPVKFFYGATFQLDLDRTEHQRVLYTWVDLLSDVGGFFCLLHLCGQFFFFILPGDGLGQFLTSHLF